MSLLAKPREVVRVLNEFSKVLPILAKFKMPESEQKISLGSVFEDSVAQHPDNTMLLFEGRQWTYAQLNGEVNRLVGVLQSRGIEPGDCVALFMENRAEFVISALAIVKLGAAAALINNSLTGAGLIHCLQATSAKICIVGEERTSVLAEVQDDLPLQAGSDFLWLPDSGDTEVPDWAEDASLSMQGMSDENPPTTREITAGDIAFYVFTSGTTGLPKAAIVRHKKIMAASLGMGRVGFQVKPEDRLYLCLPIYHITGMGPGFCTFIAYGASIYLRRSFSASKFWPEVQQYKTNSFIYVGELCRYLSMQPPCAEEKNNPLIKMMGNGLRPDVWDEFKNRFDVPRICEIYGSSEGNVSFLNFLNKDKTIGASITKVALLQYDTEQDEIVRDGAGQCIEVPVGEPGLLVAEIGKDTEFDGYTNPEATASKIIENVQAPGDRWFNTGDLIRRIDVGFALGFKHYQFVDRTGDTFRWRAENVSTNEVGEVLNLHPQINMANVYGVEVPGAEGRAGMVAFELDAGLELDLAALQTLVEQELPPYAQPVFIRILRNAKTTVTFKLLKGDLREQAYHRDKVGDDHIYVRKPRSDHYEELDDEFYQKLVAGSAGY